MEIARGIFVFRGRSGDRVRPGASTSNVTVVRGSGAAAMIDTGVVVGGALRALRARMRAQGLSFDELAWVLLTHSHWDHINACGAVLGQCRARVAGGEPEIPYFADPRRNFEAFVTDMGGWLGEVYPQPLPLVALAMRWAWGRQPRLALDRALTGGETFDIGRELRALSLPGHTPGHIAYLVPDEGVLVLGDHIDFEYAQGVDLNNPHSSYGEAMRSLERIIALEPETLVPGHGEVISGRANVRRALDEVMSFDRELPGALRRLLSRGPRDLRELTYETFTGVTPSIEGMSMMVVLNVLLQMERDGLARGIDGAGRRCWEAC